MTYCEPKIRPGAFEPEPRLVPPLVLQQQPTYYRDKDEPTEAREVAINRRFLIKTNFNGFFLEEKIKVGPLSEKIDWLRNAD